MGFPSTWLRSLKKKFNKPPGRDPADRIPSGRRLSIVALVQDEDNEEPAEVEQPRHINIPSLSAEDWAAIKIQAYFRGHLCASPLQARRAFRALRSLVKLQALARGMYVRKQARIALRCMEAIVRLQVRTRARQLLSDVQ
ncbi:hypothetical protein MLD38_007849 [Melastoma candidum]|uniref:Uncharacterized protein n=1 Tax=Melastoma candidum TaxID=119954 RepID=A0ACB9RRV4_9MYRT|nr:hypothetical protein MLD38_007849 [Melastoma candidum]